MPPYRRYFEPFLGGGALLYSASVPGSVAGDVYRPLIELWQLVQQRPAEVVASYKDHWIAVNAELNSLDLANLPNDAPLPRYYYEVRERFNRNQNPLDLNFILRTCVNGIVRFNDRGEFNNSFHLSRRGMDPARYEAVVAAWHKVLQSVRFVCQDFEVTLRATELGDFVYLDPPYAGSKNRYVADIDCARLFDALEALNSRGILWALSFDGRRGDNAYPSEVPTHLYKRHVSLSTGPSSVRRVLSGPLEDVVESLYLNY